MKKVSQISAIVFLGVFVFLSMGNPVNAITYSSGFQVQNLSSNTANISIKYYDQNGTLVLTTPETIPPNSSITKVTIDAPSPFNGSVVIESDQQIAAIVNTLGDYPTYGASTNGFSSGATSINIPLVMKGNSGFNTWFNVQNAGTASTDVTVTYSNLATETATIAPGAAKTFDQSTSAGLPSPFVGSATVTSTGGQPIVASVMQVGTGGLKVLLGYNGFIGSSTEVKLPLIMANNSGFYTGIQVQNTGATPTTVTIKYSPNTGGSFSPADESCPNLAAGASCTILHNTGQWTQKYIGGATVTAANNLVAIVNQIGSGVGNAYEGFSNSAATATALAPLIMANNSGFYTGIQVQNVGTGPCDITIVYSPGSTFTPTNDTFSGLAVGSATTFYQNSGQFASPKYVGSATISGAGAGCKIAAIVNEINPTVVGDQFYAYNAFNN